MPHEVHAKWRRLFALATIAALGLIAIVGSGGGGTDAYVAEPGPYTSILPMHMTVQVGGTATFTASTTAPQPTYQWKRSSDGGINFVDIPGATSASYTLSGVRLTDDGALFTVDVPSAGAPYYPLAARLAVSSMPSVVFQDAEFLAGDWATSSIASPAQNGPTNSEDRAATGGNPGAFRRMTYALTPGASSLRVFNTSQASSYDPASQGAIYTIDFGEDCIVDDSNPSIGLKSYLLIQQGARKYATGSGSAFGCATGAWRHSATSNFAVTAFFLLDGPACGAGESCPDFSASGAPLQFGYMRDVGQGVGAPATSIVHGIDNWKVTVWRR